MCRLIEFFTETVKSGRIALSRMIDASLLQYITDTYSSAFDDRGFVSPPPYPLILISIKPYSE